MLLILLLKNGVFKHEATAEHRSLDEIEFSSQVEEIKDPDKGRVPMIDNTTLLNWWILKTEIPQLPELQQVEADKPYLMGESGGWKVVVSEIASEYNLSQARILINLAVLNLRIDASENE